MAGKPDLSATSNVQNVVVYVSNDNFTQAYAVGQQNVQPNSHPVHSAGYTNTSNSLAPLVGPPKTFPDKQIIKPIEYSNNGQIINPSGGYFTSVLSQNTFQQPIVNNINYQNGAVVKTYGDGHMGHGRPDKVRDECDNREGYSEGYVTVMGAEVPNQSVRCDSVRSETAESSCSSLSSADESLVVVQNQPSEMVVYDPSVSVRPGGVVMAVGPPSMPQQTQNSSSTVVGTLNSNQQQFVMVPPGWKRILNNGSIIYISPSNAILSSLEQVKDYLLTAGTCKCGLECHFKYDLVFNFDPKLGNKPWVMTPDTNTGDLTKLCYHKRKILAMASLNCKPSDPNVNLRKEYNVKRKKRKIGLPYAGGVSVSQILAHREKLALNQQNFSKDVSGNSQQVWHPSSTNNPQIVSKRLQGCQEIGPDHHMLRCQDQSDNRVIEGSPVVVGGDNTVMVQHANLPANISNQPLQQNQQIHISSSMGPVSINSQQIIGPNGQIITVQAPINSQNNQGGGVVLQGHNVIQNQQQHQQRIFVNGQPSEPSGPGRPNIQMIPVSISGQQSIGNPQNQTIQQRLPHPQQQQIHFYNGQQQFTPAQQQQQYDSSKNVRPFNPTMNGFRPQTIPNHPNNHMMQVQHQQKMQWQHRVPQIQQQHQQLQQQQMHPTPQQPNQVPMGHSSPQSSQPNVYERVPPLHQHTPSPTMWQEESKRKKVKLAKNRPYVMEVVQPNNAPCPNVDVRQIPGENRPVIINQMPHSNQSAASPSFLEDPSGYLAQQTALLNSTINRQTGANGGSGYICDSPVNSIQSPQQPSSQTNEVPLPSNVVASNVKQTQNLPNNRQNQNINNIKNQQISQNVTIPHQQYNQAQIQPHVADSSVLPDQHPFSQCQGCIADSIQQQQHFSQQQNSKMQGHSRPNSTPGTPSSSGASDDPVTSSTFSDKLCNLSSPDSRPIQGGTVSTSNVSPMDCIQSDPPTPHPHTPTPPQRLPDTSQVINTSMPFVVYSQTNQIPQQQITQQIPQHIPSQSLQIPCQSPQIPSQSPHMPSQSPHMPSQSPHLPSQSPHMSTQSPHMSTQSPHMPSQSPHVPPQSSHVQSQSPHMPSQSLQMSSQTPHIPSQSPQILSQSPHVPHPVVNQLSNHSQQLSNQVQQISHQGMQLQQQHLHHLQEIQNQSQQMQNQIQNPPHQMQNQAHPMHNQQHQMQTHSQQMQNHQQHLQNHQQIQSQRDVIQYHNQNVKEGIMCCSHVHQPQRIPGTTYSTGVVTTMASGRTVGSNTITSVLAGRTNTATVSINSPSSVNGSSSPCSISNPNSPSVQTQSVTVNVSKSPLEMVQSVVSSIQIPHSQQPTIPNSQISPHIIKHSPTGLPPGHILVSSGGQLIMASTGNGQGGGVMAPPPPKLMTNQSGMPPISVSPMVTNVTASVAQVIPAVAQQVLGQQTVLVNALPAPFVLQPGVTMTMDGMTVGQNMQIPQLVTGNVIQQQIQIDNSDPRRVSALLSPETKKKGKKRKMSQTVASMLHIAAQQNSGMMMSQQGFPQQIQMAHSPQGITTGPVMQALTIVPGKSGGPPQIVMNGQPMANANLGAQQLITNSQPAQQINLLQPVNLINSSAGVVQNFPAIQQFIVPNLGGMVMNPDGTATILQDTSNLGMQLQIQNVNGQNVLTPVQNNAMFNGGQSILAAGPAGMVIRAPTSQGKIIQQQQHSPGAQFLSPNGGQFVVNGAQFSGQLSPLVASVSPSQQVTFSTSPQQIRPNTSMQSNQQEYIQMNGQMGQTLMVPCTPAASIAVSSANQQNTTFVQQNTTIVQQQTTMVANNQQLQNFQQNNQQQNQQNVARTATLNVDQQNYIISSNDNKQMQAVVVQQQRDLPQNSINYRQSVSTQTAVNQNAQSVTTNTFCQTSTISAGSPPDTTTLSPLAPGGQSPATADTTTHTGSTDDGLSPAPSNCSASCSDINIQTRPQSCTMAMVHCISSSEPDSADLNSQNSEPDWRRGHQMSTTPKSEYSDVTSGQSHFAKKSTPTHVTFPESSNLVAGLQYRTDQMKQQEPVVSSRNYEKMMQHKRKNSTDTLVVMEAHHIHTSLFEDDEENDKNRCATKTFVVGDLVWGPTKNCPSWPGKITEVHNGSSVTVKWFGTEKFESIIDNHLLQTLSEGLDTQHQSRKETRTSRKLNSQLENAIQEAMSELDKQVASKNNVISKPTELMSKPSKHISIEKKTAAGRSRSSKK